MTYGYITNKWPAMAVRGSTLTREQANEVIVRMSSPWLLCGNDQEWQRQVHKVFGVTCDRYEPDFWDQNVRSESALRHVPTMYLSLGGRIYSAMIGGAYGWCDWDGRISSAYNIGKWPSIDELSEEWSEVAEAFPFLSLTAQVFDAEIEFVEDGAELVGEWTVAAGRAVFSHQSGEQIDVSGMYSGTDKWDEWFANRHCERHVSIDQLNAAVTQVRESHTLGEKQ